MRQASEKLVNATNEVMNLTMKEMCSPEVIETMDENNLKLLQLTLQLVKASNEYVRKSGEMMDNIDRKLNELLKGAKGV